MKKTDDVVSVSLPKIASVTGIDPDDIRQAIRDKKVWAYRKTEPEASFETWMVDLNSFVDHFFDKA